MFISLAYTGAFLYPVAKIVNVSTGFSVQGCIIFLGVLIMIYTAVGGLWVVIITDVLQFAILTAAVMAIVPLAIQEVGGLEHFFSSAPADFFDWTNEEYNLGFLFAFAIYNGIFIGGNWAYVQRYTSVESPKEAGKVGYLFTILYLISPLIWMLPPMLYRVLNNDLGGLENEGAYLLICKAVLPVGMLGLMLGGMVFATASSVNTTLNLSAAVFTHDIYKQFWPHASLKRTMWVARASTLLFGVGTIAVALLVPAAGGIVEVVLSVGAVTGCSLYGPPIWALFSKRQTGTSVLIATFLSLAINLFLKFITPYLFNFALSRSEEMLLGPVTPFFLLGVSELWFWNRDQISSRYKAYKQSSQNGPELDTSPKEDDSQNIFGLKVLSNTLGVVGLLIGVLGLMAENGRVLVFSIGLLIMLVALYLNPKVKIARILRARS